MNIVSNEEWTVNVPAGKYYLGDPCYVVPNNLWHKLLASCGHFADSPVGIVNGHNVLAFSTMHGDGSYQDQYGNDFDVDAGLIGIVPVELVDQNECIKNYGKVPNMMIEFNYDVIARRSLKGTLTFGKYTIQTGD